MVKVGKLVEAGVPIVWVINPEKEVVEVYHAAQGYVAGPVRVLGVGDELDGDDVIPGFHMPVAQLFVLKRKRRA